MLSCLLVGLFAHQAAAKQKPAKGSAASNVRPQKAQVQAAVPEETGQEEKIQEQMQKYLGVRYKRGGNTTKGFDCSGFVRHVYGEVFGIDLPHQSSQQNGSGFLTTISSDRLKTGDLVFFSSGRKRKAINHVGIYLSDGRFIHSSRSKGVVISSFDDPYWKVRLVSTKRPVGMRSMVASVDSQTMLGLGTALGEKSLFTFQVTSAQLESFYPSLAYNERLQFAGDRYDRLEFNVLKGLWVDSWSARFTAFREHFSLAQEDPLLAPRSILQEADFSESSYMKAYTQGLRVASDIRPNEWVRVSPSVTYFDYGAGIDFSDLPKVALGLDFNLASSSEGWSLTTGFQYPLSRYASTRLADQDMSDSRAVDMTLTFRQWLSDSIQFSVTGERSYRYSYGPKDAQDSLADNVEQIFIALHFFY